MAKGNKRKRKPPPKSQIAKQQPSGNGSLVAKHESVEWSGPLPPPGILAEYERVLPGSAERIFGAFEQQGDHRRKLETSVVVGGGRRSWTGQLLGFVVVIAFLIVSAWLIDRGHSVAGTIIGTVDLASVAGVFVYGRYSQRSELERKSR